MHRIVTALVGVPLLLAVIKLTSPLMWFFLCLVTVGFASWELLNLLKIGGHRVYRSVTIGGSLLAMIPFIEPRIDAALPVIAGGAAAIIWGTLRARDLADVVDGALCTVFSIVFVGLNLGYMVALRSMSYGVTAAGVNWTGVAPLEIRFHTSPADSLGQDLLILLILVVWCGDAAAYWVGSAFGRTKLAPTVSPKKTVEGALAGVVTSTLVALLATQWFFRRLPPSHALAIGLILGISGIVGDLSESVIKRAAGAKDSAAVLPGHGGILDRVDSLLLAAPALYYYHRALLAGVLS